MFTHHFNEALQQIQFKHKASSTESFALPGQKALSPKELENNLATAWEMADGALGFA